MAPCPASTAVIRTCCVLLMLLLWAEVVVRLPPVAGQQAPQPEDSAAAAAIIEAEGDGRGNGNGTRGGGGGASRNKVLSTVDCQICEATCRVKCLINNLFQWGSCYQRCKADNCNEWCR